MKYIDADRLREKVTDRLDLFKELSSDTISPIRIDECKQIIDIIDSLQQEQPEVELTEETITNEFRVIQDKCFNEGIEGWQREKLIARHFFDLGLNARKL